MQIKRKLVVLAGLLLLAIIFTRFFNLPATSRFTRDESSNLVDMHRIFVQRELTLVGPIDVVSYVIYPSLTFYMLLPFAILGNFSTFSPAYGTAFYGILTVILLIYATAKINKRFLIPVSLLFIVWYPLVEASRWAWNPYLVPFTSVLAVIFWKKTQKWSKFVSGLLFGLTFHLHYFSLVSSGAFLLLGSLFLLKERKFKEVVSAALGFILTIIPFIIFDLRNPPGLFFGRFLHNNLVTEDFSTKILKFGITLPQNIYNSLLYLSQTPILAIISGVLIVCILLLDIKNKSKSLVYFLPFIAQVIAISLLPVFAGRYVLLGIVFFVIWMIYPRKTIGVYLSKILIILLTVGSLTQINNLLTKPQIEPGAAIVEYASRIIESSTKSESLKNVNLAILGSADPDPFGKIYRHTLLVKEIRVLSEGEYGITDNLFVVSTSLESNLRNDPASLMNGFRSGKMVEEVEIEGTDWKVYLFNRD